MDTIPIEIMLEIGKTDIATYRGMLAIPKFARAVTVGYRLDMMVVTGYKYEKHEKIIDFYMVRKQGSHILRLLIYRSIITNKVCSNFRITDHEQTEKYTYYYKGPSTGNALGVVCSNDDGRRTLSLSCGERFDVSQFGTLY